MFKEFSYVLPPCADSGKGVLKCTVSVNAHVSFNRLGLHSVGVFGNNADCVIALSNSIQKYTNVYITTKHSFVQYTIYLNLLLIIIVEMV